MVVRLDLKIGSRVKLIKTSFANLIVGQTYTVSAIHESGTTFNVKEISEIWKDVFPCSNSSNYWELVPTPLPLYSEEQAVAFLTEKGYHVQAPPEPLKGELVVYIYADETQARALPHEEFDRLNHIGGKHRRKVLAIVDWTEGQGLSSKSS